MQTSYKREMAKCDDCIKGHTNIADRISYSSKDDYPMAPVRMSVDCIITLFLLRQSIGFCMERQGILQSINSPVRIYVYSK